MKRLLLCSVFTLAVASQAAFAADLMPRKAPPRPLVMSSWQGAYVGGNVGYGAAVNRTSMDTVSAAGFPGLTPGTTLYGGTKHFALTPAGLNGGVQAGYNWLFSPNLVAGVEADFQWSGMNDGLNCLVACNARVSTTPGLSLFPVVFSEISSEQQLKWFGTARARLGSIWGPSLFYVTGGLAYGEVERSARVSGRTVGAVSGATSNTFAGSFSNSSVLVGWTIGAGIESKVSSQWSAKAEYLYMDLGDVTDQFSTVYQTSTGAAVPGTLAATRTDKASFQNHVFRLGLNYHLQPGAPGMDAMASAWPAAASAHSWTGTYVGANLGYGVGTHDALASSVNAAGAPTYGGPQHFNLGAEGLVGGVQAGANWHFSGTPWVVGGEADFQWSGIKDSVACIPITCGARIAAASTGTALFPVVFSENSADHRLNWFGTVRGRLGYAAGPVLFYATGGLAYGEIEQRRVISGRTVGAITGTTVNTFAGSSQSSSVHTGWTLGGGAEMHLTNRLTVRAEYLYLDFGDVTESFNTLFTGGGVSGTHAISSDFSTHTFRLGMNYMLTAN